MLRRAVCATSLVAGLLLLAGRSEGQKAGKGPALSPDFMVVSALDAKGGRITLRMNQLREQQVQELSVGPGVTLKSEMVVGPFQAERFLNLKDCQVLTASGEAVPPAAFPRRLKVGAIVVVSTDGKRPARAFLQLLRPDTVVVIGPAVKSDPRIKLPPGPPPPPLPPVPRDKPDRPDKPKEAP